MDQQVLDLDGGWHAGPLFIASKRRAPMRHSTRMHGVWRRFYERRATPKCSTVEDRKAVRAMYREARRLTRETGIRHSVDHIYPLVHHRICGLHIARNMEVKPLIDNLRKGNYWFEGEPDEQLELALVPGDSAAESDR